MLEKNKHKRNSLSDFLDYLKGLLSGRERNDFEKGIQKDPFAEEAMEGLESLKPEEVEEDLLKLNARLNKRLEKRNRILYFRIAATIAIILTVSTLYFTLSDRQLEEFQGPREVTEAVKKEGSKDEQNMKPVEKAAKGNDTARQDNNILVEPEQADRGDKAETETEEKTVLVLEDESVTKAGEKGPLIAKDELQTEKDKTTVQRELTQAEIVAAEVQEEAITVPEKQEAVSIPQQAIPTTRSYAKKAVSEVPASSEIKGTVLSAEDNMPLPGVSVRVSGTTNGAVSDSEGNFSIPGVNEENPKLVASVIGMEDMEVDARRNENNQILMEPSAVALDEVVVIGSGRKSVSQVSGAVSEIKDLDNEIDNTYRAAYPVEGTGHFKDYIEENVNYPDSTVDRAVVVLKFVVTKSGRPSQIEVLKSPSDEFSDEAVRLLKEGPDWVPAENEGQYIEDKTRMRIVFKKQS